MDENKKPSDAVIRTAKFKDSLKNVSKPISVVRWMFMIIALTETIAAAAFTIMCYMPQANNWINQIFKAADILNVSISLASIVQLALLIILGIDAALTKTEIKVRIEFVALSVIPIMLMWKYLIVFWKLRL